MTLEFLRSKGFTVDVIRIADPNNTLYEVRIYKNGKALSSKCTEDGVRNNIEPIYQDLYLRFMEDLKEAKKATKKRERYARSVWPCRECGSTYNVKKMDHDWVCEKCAIYIDAI